MRQQFRDCGRLRSNVRAKAPPLQAAPPRVHFRSPRNPGIRPIPDVRRFRSPSPCAPPPPDSHSPPLSSSRSPRASRRRRPKKRAKRGRVPRKCPFLDSLDHRTVGDGYRMAPATATLVAHPSEQPVLHLLVGQVVHPLQQKNPHHRSVRQRRTGCSCSRCTVLSNPGVTKNWKAQFGGAPRLFRSAPTS